MPSKTVKRNNFKEILIAKMDEYIDQAFATNDPEKRQKYREVIRQMENILIAVAELD